MTAKARKVKKIKYTTDERAVINKTGIDIGFLVTVIMLVVLGLIMVFSASYPSANYRYGNGLYFITRQAIWAVVGAAAMFFTAKVDYRVYKKFVVPIMAATVVLLALVLASKPINGARRWLGVGSFSFQPSEFAKISVIIFLSYILSNMKETLKDIKKVLIYIGALGAVLVLLLLEPHLSVCIIICFVLAIMLLVAGFPAKVFWTAVLILAPLAIFITMGADYRSDRITAYLDPFADKQGDGWQIIQSLYAIGSGGFFGLGFGNSRQKFMYVSEPQNDFIFAIICEELGIVGAFVVIVLFGVLIWRGVKIAINAPDNFGSLLVIGNISLVGVQAFLNIAVVTKLIPTTGVSLPFFSAGGSSMVFLMAAMGMVLNVSTHKRHIVSVK